jgi:hypothetical protein
VNAGRDRSRAGALLGALLGWLLVLGGCAAYDPELVEKDTPPASDQAGRGAGRGGAGGGGGGGGRGGNAGRGGTAGSAVTPDAAVPDSGGAGADAQPPMPDAAVDAATDASNPDPEDAAQDAQPPEPDAGCVAVEGGEDCCPNDPAKTLPGACGCGVADTDGDSDGTLDCMDGCPGDAMKTAPGTCGCGRPESGAVSCTALRNALLHRYRFNGSGTAVVDTRSDQDGMAINATLNDNGRIDLAGGTTDQYVDLPNGMISALTDATFEVWLTWTGGNAWQRILDFGDNNAAEGAQGTGTSYLYLTPRSSSGFLIASFTLNGSSNETRVEDDAVLPSGMRHVAVVVDDVNNSLLLYLDGALVDSATLGGSLSGIADVNNWLGRSQYSNDPELAGSLHEFRIYSAALSAAQIAFSFADGPDPAYLE